MRRLLLSVMFLAVVLLLGFWLFLRSRGVSEISPPAEGATAEFVVEKADAGDWPGWRGLGGTGRRAVGGPLRWSSSQHVAWKVSDPGHGHAAPISWREQVFLFTADEQTKQRILLSYQRDKGTLLWQTAFHHGDFPVKHVKNSHASATPACDGCHVYLSYLADDALWAAAVDLQGQVAWKTKVGPFVSQHGYGASPALFNNLVIVAGDNKGSRLGHVAGVTSYLAGLHRKTGEIVWRVRRPRVPGYATPIVADVAGRPQVLLAGRERVTAYDPATGQELWFCRYSAQRPANSLAVGRDCVFASASLPDAEVLCIRADGQGDVTDSHVLWRQRPSACDVPSPLFHDDLLYLISDKGIATCLDATTGRSLWKERLDGTFTASPVVAGARIYATNEEGTTYVLKAGRQFELVATNSIGDAVLSSPALVGDRLLIRSRGSLWCIGANEAAAQQRRHGDAAAASE